MPLSGSGTSCFGNEAGSLASPIVTEPSAVAGSVLPDFVVVDDVESSPPPLHAVSAPAAEKPRDRECEEPPRHR